MNQARNGAAGNTVLMHTAFNLYINMAGLGWPGSCTAIKVTSAKLASPGQVIRPLYVLSRSLHVRGLEFASFVISLKITVPLAVCR